LQACAESTTEVVTSFFLSFFPFLGEHKKEYVTTRQNRLLPILPDSNISRTPEHTIGREVTDIKIQRNHSNEHHPHVMAHSTAMATRLGIPAWVQFKVKDHKKWRQVAEQ